MNEAVIRILAETAQFEKAMAQVETTTARVSGALGALGITVGVGAFSSFIASTIEAAAQLHDMSMQTGMTVEDLSALRDIAEMNGVSLDQVGAANARLIKTMADARKGSIEQAATFKALGLSVTDATGALLGSRDTMIAVAKAIAEIASPTERAAAAQDVFGKSGAALIPMLLDLADAGGLQATITAEQAAQADTFSDAMTGMQQGVKNSAQSLAVDLVPAFAVVADVVQGSIVGIQIFGRQLAVVAKGVETAVKVIGAGIGGGFTQEGQDYIKRTLEEHQGFMDAASDDIQGIALRYRSIVGQVLDAGPARAGGTRSYVSKVRDEGAALKKEVEAFEALMARLNGKDSGLDAGFGKDLNLLHKAYQSGRLDLDGYRAAVELLVTQQKFHIDAMKEEAKVWEDFERSTEDFLKNRAQVKQSWEEKAAAIEAETEVMLLSNEERERAIILHQLEAQELIIGAEAYGRLKQRMESALANRSSQSRIIEEQAGMWRSIEGVAHQTFDSINDANKDLWERMKETGQNIFYDWLYQMTLKRWVINLSVATSGVAAAEQAFGASAVQQAAGNGLNLPGIPGLNAGSMVTGFGNLVGSTGISAFGTGMGLTGAEAAGAAAAYNAAGMTSVGSSLTAGSAISTAIPYIGAAVAVASLLGDLFGDKKPAPPELISFTTNDGGAPWFGYDNYRQDGPFGEMVLAGQHLKRNGVDINQLGQQYVSPITELDKMLAASMSSDEIKSVSDAIWNKTNGEFDNSGGSFDALFRNRLDWMTDAIGGWVNDIADQFNTSLQDGYTVATALLDIRGREFGEALSVSLAAAMTGAEQSDYLMAGETAGTAFVRLAGNLIAVNDVLSALDQTALAFTASGAAAATTLVDAFGGAQNFQATSAAYYQAIYSEEEKTRLLTEQVSGIFEKLNEVMPATRDEMRALVGEYLDMGEAGAGAVASLMGVAPALAQVIDAAEKAAQDAIKVAQEATNAAAKTAMDAVGVAYDAVQRSIDAERQRLDAQRALAADSLTAIDAVFATAANGARTLRGSVDGIGDALRTEARAYLDMAQSLALTGGRPDNDRLAQAVATLQTDSMANYATVADYEYAQLVQAAKLDKIRDAMGDQKSVAEMQLDALDQQTAQLDAQLTAAQAQIDALNGIDTSVHSVADAIATLANALGMAATAALPGQVAAASASSAANATPGYMADVVAAQSSYGGDAYYFIAGVNDLSAKLANATDYANKVGISVDAAMQAVSGASIAYWQQIEEMYNAGLRPTTMSLPKFDVGTNYVTRDTLAMVHQGEEIKPARYVDRDRRGMEDIGAELRALRTENAALRGEMTGLLERIETAINQPVVISGDSAPIRTRAEEYS